MLAPVNYKIEKIQQEKYTELILSFRSLLATSDIRSQKPRAGSHNLHI